MDTQNKRSGTKFWLKVTSNQPGELKLLSILTGIPLKPAAGKNPEHLDVPLKKAKLLGIFSIN